MTWTSSRYTRSSSTAGFTTTLDLADMVHEQEQLAWQQFKQKTQQVVEPITTQVVEGKGFTRRIYAEETGRSEIAVQEDGNGA